MKILEAKVIWHLSDLPIEDEPVIIDKGIFAYYHLGNWQTDEGTIIKAPEAWCYIPVFNKRG